MKNNNRAIVLRLIPNNGGGGARIHCFQVNRILESEFGLHTVTFIPKAPFDDRYTDKELVSFEYINTFSIFRIFSFVVRNRRKIIFISSHLRKANIIGFFLSKIFLLPHVVTVHFPYKSRIFFDYLYRLSLNAASRVIYISNFVKLHTENSFAALNENSCVIYNGSDESEVTSSSSQDRIVRLKEIRFCIVGELSERKGLLDLALILDDEGFLNSLDTKIIINIYGQGELIDLIREWRTSSNVEINLYGYVTEPDQIYLSNDYLLSLSYHEAFGRTLSEAMARGIPCICRNSGAFPELVEDGSNGFIFDSITDLKKIIKVLIEENFDYHSLSTNALKVFKDNLSTNRFNERMSNFYKDYLCQLN